MATLADSNDAFTAFWNDVLAAKFERFRNILLDGLSFHSAVPLAPLALPSGASAVDVGCGWGDTAIELARKVGPAGKVVGLDCCDAFLEKGRRDAAAEGLRNVHFVAADVATHRFER
jgi:ubiquinone/menaquinone biosynthesis C-methylase UbiE